MAGATRWPGAEGVSQEELEDRGKLQEQAGLHCEKCSCKFALHVVQSYVCKFISNIKL